MQKTINFPFHILKREERERLDIVARNIAESSCPSRAKVLSLVWRVTSDERYLQVCVTYDVEELIINFPLNAVGDKSDDKLAIFSEQVATELVPKGSVLHRIYWWPLPEQGILQIVALYNQ